MKLRHCQAALCVALAAAVAAPPPEPSLARFEFSQIHMGTQFRIVLYAPDRDAATTASRAAFARITALDHTMSDYSASSELTQLCAQAGGLPLKVSDDLFRVLAKAREVSEASQGAFDVTAGPLIRLWRRTRRQHDLPDAESLAKAMELVGYSKLLLNPADRTVRLPKPGMLLDLGGIAKGDAADQALLVLKNHGTSRALVAAGGDIVAGQPPPGREGWRIAVAQLESPRRTARHLLLHDAAVSTSGDAQQHVEINGTRYSHIIDPKTGWALTGRSSVTVIAPNGITADSLATAVSVLGPERGLRLVESFPGATVLFVLRTEQGVQTFESRLPALPATN